jgi:hypothetical protein
MSSLRWSLSVALVCLIGLGEAPVAFAKGGRGHAPPHRHRVQRPHPRPKIHAKNPKRHPGQHKPPKKHPRPKPGRVHAKGPMPRRPLGPLAGKHPVTPKPPTGKTTPRPRVEARRFVRFNEATGEHWFDNHWWYNFVVYPTTVDRSEAFQANYQTIVPPPSVTVTPPVIKRGQGLPLSPAGSSLAVQLDRLDVEHHWLPGSLVAWRTGDALDGSAQGPASNGSAFVAAVCARLKVPMPGPVAENLVPAAQHDWLVNDGLKKGWVEIGALEAQLLANQGWVVVAAWKDAAPAGERSLAGQTAIVRPSRKPATDIAPNGPRIIEASVRNHNDISLKDGFPARAWSSRQVVYLAHRPG